MPEPDGEPARHPIDVGEAMRIILEHMPAMATEKVPLAEALGGVLHDPLRAERDLPPFDRVTMDGIAITAAAAADGRAHFHLRGTQAAGTAPLALHDDSECVAVMTGCILPDGAGAVVPIERLAREGDDIRLQVDYRPQPGQCIHRQGSDHPRGAELLPAGTRIGPAEMAILTVGGSAAVSIGAQPKIAVVSTGDELVEPGQPVEAFQVRSSNDRSLEAALRSRGLRQVQRCLLPDDPVVLERELRRLHERNDLLILSGGVSMGEFDYVPATLAALGIEVLFHKVTQRPGLPMWFGRGPDGKVVFALPGNPVSSLVCLVRYVLPALEHSMGARPARPRMVKLAEPVDFAPDLTLFLPVMLDWQADGNVSARPRPTNTSGDFVSLRGTDGFVELPRGANRFNAGHPAPFFAW